MNQWPPVHFRGFFWAVLCAFTLLAAAPAAVDANPKKDGPVGHLHVAAYYDTAEQPGLQFSYAFIYTPNGTKIPGPEEDDGWSVGIPIELEAGEYWVGVGLKESKSNLYWYVVGEGRTTVVPTGWVSVLTVPAEEQPEGNCRGWRAELRASILAESGEREEITHNVGTKPDTSGNIQLHPGQYLVKFHHFTTVVEVEEGKEFRPATGYLEGSDAEEQFLILKRSDDPSQVGLPVCANGVMHLLAGDYFLSETVVTDDKGRVERFTQPVVVEESKADGSGYKSLKRERVRKKRSLSPDEGRQISPEEIGALTEWGTKQSPFEDLEIEGF